MFLFEIFHDAQNSMDLNFVITILVFAHSKYFLMHITLSSKLAKHLFTPFVQWGLYLNKRVGNQKQTLFS